MRDSLSVTTRGRHSGRARGLHAATRLHVAPATRTPTERRAGEQRAIEPPYRVVLHNDDVHGMHEVVHALLASVPELDQPRAAEIMLEAHLHGRAEVIVCPRDRAAIYRDRLQSYGLTATIEPA